ncbi:TipJ family phage tail tip protein [Pseudomonas cremoricolorata]|uniref:TipJ family phage tail tip protein n=1 Tax=Pseudomonas cremoricolorata TaxID=157783 RepID=UPI00056DFBCF|nr:DUF1983 domain-containing protein [Pseudomonas cremoricolorata]
MGGSAHLDITGAKGGQKQPKAPVEAPDSLQSTNIAKILLAVGEGEFDGVPTDRDIYLDNTPIRDANGTVNFPGVKWEWRSGSVEQAYIQGIPAVENEISVGLELRSDNPFSRALSDPKLSAVRVRLAWPRLLRQDSNGNTNGYRIEYAIDIATDGGAYVEAHRGAVDGKTNNGYQRSVRVNLPSASSGWMLRVRRLTANANSGSIADTMNIAGYTEIIDHKLRYPNTALLYLEFDAQQFQNIPAVTVNCKAKRWPVPSNYDPIARTYSGIWDGTFKQAWTNNPALVTYGLCVENRFGLGKRIKPWMVDKWEMYRIAQYCDQRVPDGTGGEEPRFLCDLNLQGRAEAWTLLRDLSAIYRGMVYWAHGALFMQADMPRARDIDYVFTRANVIDGEFIYGGAERSSHYSRALVSYDNPANNYDTDVIAVTDPALQRRYRDRPIELSAIACTRASEAQRRGKWALLSNDQDRTVTFRTGMEGRIPLPGHVIPVADELVAGRANGGRISAASGRVVTLDRDTPIKAGDRLIVNLPNGTAQARTVRSVRGRAVTLTVAYSVQPEPHLQWAIDYADLAVQLFRVLKTTRTAQGDFEITALEFNPSKFAAIDTGAKLDATPVSVLPSSTVAAPASVALSAAHAVDQGIAVTTLTIAWPAVAGAGGYEVEWRKDNGNWIRLPRTGATSVEVVGIYAGDYQARVRAVSALEISSSWRDSPLTTLKGKQGVPPAVTSLTTQSQLFGIALKWTLPNGAEDTQRTELWYSEGSDRAKASKLADLAYPQDKHVLQGLRAGQRFFFWARLVDRLGNLGAWFPADGKLVTGVASAEAGPILEQIKEQITASELGKELLKEIDKISAPATLAGSVNARLSEVQTQVQTDLGTVRNDVGQVRQTVQNLDAELERSVSTLEAEIDRSAASLDANVRQVGQQLEQVRGNLQTQITDLDAIARSVPYAKGKVYSSGQSVQGADGRLYQAIKAVPVDSPPPDTRYWLDVGQTVGSVNGLAGRVQKVESDVSSVNGTLTAQASQLSGLQASLLSTDRNVSAAQSAADAANALAGGKGKVLVQSSQPVAADRLAQNLWIDTTANANTPKRWSGSAWLAVTDKAASDAAAAAADALALARSKADASVVDSLSSRVSEQGTTLSSQGQALTGLQNSLVSTNGNVTAAQQAAQAASDLAGSKGKVIVQNTAPAAAERLGQNLWIDTSAGANTPKRWNGSAWLAVTDKVASDAATAAAAALSQVASKAESSVVQALTGRVEQNERGLSSQSQAMTGLQNSLSSTDGNVGKAQQAAQAATELAGSKGKVIVQNAAPAAAERLAQNLWIDTTGNANTPKRWNGSAWTAVTDKVASDAAQAAASALSQVASKAEASSVQALSNTVSQQGATLNAQGSELTTLKASVGALGSDNLLADPTFAQGIGIASRAGTRVLLRTETPVPAGAPSARVLYEALPASTAGNQYWSFLPADNARAPEGRTATHIAVAAGEVYDFELYAFSSTARQQGLWIQFYDAAGTNLAQSWANSSGDGVRATSVAGTWSRLSGSLTVPANGVRMTVALRVSQGDATEVFIAAPGVRRRQSLDHAQASATTALDGRVTQTEQSITSQSSQITQLGNTVAGKADNSALQSLASGVSRQGEVLNAQGSALTRVQATLGGLGGAGTNLLPDAYSWLSSAALPGLMTNGIGDVRAAADPVAASGYRLRLVRSAAANGWVMLCPSNDSAGWNIPLVAGNYLLSFWANGNPAAIANGLTLRSALRDSRSFGLTDFALTTRRTRYTSVVAVSAETVAAVLFYVPTGSEGDVLWIDSIMLERQLGDGSAPSAFVAGPSAQALTSVATATQALDARVTRNEGITTSQAETLTRLNGTLDGKADAASVSQLGNRVSQTEQGLTAQGQSLVSLATSIGNTGHDNLLRNPAFNAGGELKSFSTSTSTLSYFDRGTADTPAGAPADRLLRYEKTGEFTGWGGFSLIASNGTEQTPVTPGEVMCFECQMLCENNGQSIGRVAFTYWEGDSGAQWVNGNQRLLNYNWSQGGWQTLSIEHTVPATAGRLSIYLVPNDGGAPIGFKMWVANPRLTRRTAAQTALASATEALTNRVQQTESGLNSQSQSLTQLSNSLQAATGNAAAAQQAAQAASDLAGSKGRVIVQSPAPGSADRLVQNLWIDTTGGANTPKRWNGSAWVGVTDKVASDAAAAAASALSQVANKAEAATVQALTSRVEKTEGGMLSQGKSLTDLQNSLTTTNGSVSAAQQAAQAASELAGSKGKVIVQPATPVAADRLAQNLWIDTTGNANTPKRWAGSAWVTVTDKVASDAAAAAASALSQVATKAESTALQALSNSVNQQGTTLAAQGTAVTQLQSTLGGLGGVGTNLIPAEYCSFTDKLPVIQRRSTTLVTAEPFAAAYSTHRLKVRESVDDGTGYFCLYANNAMLNLRLKPSTRYLFSAWVQSASQARLARLRQRYVTSDGGQVEVHLANLPLTTEWTRISVSFITPAALVDRAELLIFTNPASGSQDSWWDGFMLEEQVGANAFPSSFTPGTSSYQAITQATATTALEGRVTQTEQGLTSQSSQLTQLSNTLAGKADNSALQSLVSAVGKQGESLTAQGTAVTRLQSSLDSISGSGANLIPAEYCSFSETLPVIQRRSTTLVAAESYAAAYSTQRLKVSDSTSNGTGYFSLYANNEMLNLRLKPDTRYIFSAWVQSAGEARTARLRQRYVNSSGEQVEVQLANFPLTTQRTRVAVPFTSPAELVDRAGLLIFTVPGPRSQESWWDGFMLEEQIGASAVPSSFTPGTSSYQAASQATAISQLQTQTEQMGSTVTAQTSRLDLLTAQSGSNAASISQSSQVLSSLDGRVAAMTSIKTETLVDGRKVLAGLTLGSGANTSEILAYANRFAIVNPGGKNEVSLPFVVQDGQVFLNEALINKAMITNAVVGSSIVSAERAANGQAALSTNYNSGEIVLRSKTSSGSYTVIKDNGVFIIANGVVMVEMSLD